MLYHLGFFLGRLIATLFRRILLTGFGDPIYVPHTSRVPILEGGDLYLALKKAGVGAATSPETVRLEQRRSAATSNTKHSRKRNNQMASKADQYLDEIANGKLSQSAARISDGLYEPMVIKRIFMIEDGYNGDSIVVEFVVIDAKPVSIPADLLRPGETVGQAQPNAPGSVCGMANNMSDKKKREVTVNVMMGLFAALFNWDKAYAESTDPNVVATRIAKIKEAISPSNPFAGYPVNVDTYRARLRQKQTEIHTRTRFRHCPTTPDEIAKMRAIVLAKG